MFYRPFFAILVTIVSLVICAPLWAQAPTAQQIMAQMETLRVAHVDGVDNYTVVEMTSMGGPPAVHYYERAMEGGTAASVFRLVLPHEVTRRNHSSGQQESAEAMLGAAVDILGPALGSAMEAMEEAGISMPDLAFEGGVATDTNEDALSVHRTVAILSPHMENLGTFDFRGRRAYQLVGENLQDVEGLESQLGPGYELRSNSLWIDVEHLVVLRMVTNVVNTQDDNSPMTIVRNDYEFRNFTDSAMREPGCTFNEADMEDGIFEGFQYTVRRYFVEVNAGLPTAEQTARWMAEYMGRAVTPCSGSEIE